MILNLAKLIAVLFLLSDLLTAFRGVGRCCGMCSYQILNSNRTAHSEGADHRAGATFLCAEIVQPEV